MSIVNGYRGLIYENPFVRAFREEIGELRYDLHQIPGSPPIPLEGKKE